MDAKTINALTTVMHKAKVYGVDDECFDEFMRVNDWVAKVMQR
jgi:hypothetical protein